jgi:hypothetical protein
MRDRMSWEARCLGNKGSEPGLLGDQLLGGTWTIRLALHLPSTLADTNNPILPMVPPHPTLMTAAVLVTAGLNNSLHTEAAMIITGLLITPGMETIATTLELDRALSMEVAGTTVGHLNSLAMVEATITTLSLPTEEVTTTTPSQIMHPPLRLMGVAMMMAIPALVIIVKTVLIMEVLRDMAHLAMDRAVGTIRDLSNMGNTAVLLITVVSAVPLQDLLLGLVTTTTMALTVTLLMVEVEVMAAAIDAIRTKPCDEFSTLLVGYYGI